MAWFFAAVLCVAAAEPSASAGTGSEYSKLKLATLKRMLFVRGVACAHCTTKAEWVAQLELNADLPEQEDLAAEWASQKEYAKKAKELSMTRDEFIRQINETETYPLEGERADRLWAAFQEQLREGHVEFLENGSVRFSMPLTHRVSPFLHPRLVDAIEWTARGAQSGWRRLPRRWRRQVEHLLDWAVESGTLHAAVIVLLTVILLDFLFERRRWRTLPHHRRPCARPVPAVCVRSGTHPRRRCPCTAAASDETTSWTSGPSRC